MLNDTQLNSKINHNDNFKIFSPVNLLAAVGVPPRLGSCPHKPFATINFFQLRSHRWCSLKPLQRRPVWSPDQRVSQT